MKAFVTGGSGFLGRSVVQKLCTQGHEVIALTRSADSAAKLITLGATPLLGDITNRESMRDAMSGADVVFHLAAWHEMDNKHWRTAELTNVSGTRNVLSLAHEVGVPRIIYTSTIEIFGDTQGAIADETYYTEQPLTNHYERTKWQAHYQVALPLIKKGAPITIVMPGLIYGPDDPSVLGDLMYRFFYDLPPFPLLPGPHTKFAYTHVDDVADGHLQAWEKGQIGESYILAGSAVSLGEMVEFWARLLGKRPPLIHLTRSFLQPVSPLLSQMAHLFDLPPILTAEATEIMGATHSVIANKAKQELGWNPQPLQVGMLDTFKHIEEKMPPPLPSRPPEQTVAIMALVTAAALVTFWALGRLFRRK